MTRFLSRTLCAAGLALAAGGAQANVSIDFETGYSDNELLADNQQLLDSNGVASIVRIVTAGTNTMSIEASGDASDSAADDEPDGFVNDPLGNGNDDTETSPPGGLGGFFLRNTIALAGDVGAFSPVFTLTFDKAITSATGEIWDIDGNTDQGTEKWDVVANLVAGGTVTDTSPEGTNTADATSLNGQPWEFSFSGIGQISSIDFFFEGSKTQGIGVAFDNLEVAPVPLPAAGLVLLGALGGLAAYRRRRAA